ncbi:MAG: hypothetical protein JSW08_01430 [archaeon]|nr:MAG: hypothetical protein JSW08_01430 [archaeon]
MVNNPSPILEKLSSIKKESVLEAINDYLLKCSQVITISWSFDMFGDALIDRMVDLLNKEGKYSEETTKMILSKGILSIFIKEKKEFLSLMRNIKNKSKEEINEALQKHLKKWYFIGMGTVTEKPFSIEDFENKFDFFKDKDLDQEIKRIEELKNKEDKEISKFINDSNLSRRLLEAINQIRKYMSFKNNERVMLHDYTFKSFTIFNKIKKICSYEDHRFIFFKDVISFIKEEIDHQELLERAKRRENKRYELLVEDDQLKIKEIEKQKEVFVGGNLFKGLAVSKGFMRGPIKIVKDPSKEHQKLNNGDILVTSMTTPNFVPLMERAAAIITEEGGMLCHAAIVSRELGIPAVVGVRGIMSSLKDGDLVEIDAEKGIVKILK